MQTSIHVRKEALKFSSAHMTVLPGGIRETLHGHNYQTAIHVELVETSKSQFVPFALVKQTLRTLCEAWDEKLLLAAKNSYFEIVRHTDELEFRLCGDRFVVPSADAVLLEATNITTEELSRLLCEKVVKALESTKEYSLVHALEVTVDENGLQGATTRWSRAT